MSAPQREPVRGHEVQQPPVAGGGGGGRASAPGVVKPKPTLRPGVGGCRRRTCGVSATGCAGFRDRGVAHAAHADTLAFAPRDPGRRVLRGGSWFDYAGLLRPGARFGVTAALRGDGRGFRVSRTLEGRPRPPGSQAPGQVGTFPPAASAPRSRRTRTRNRTPAPRRSASGIGTRGTPCAGGSSRAPASPARMRRPTANPAAAPSTSRNGMSTDRTIRPSKRRPAARTPSSSAPGPGTPTMTSASVSATHRLSSHGNRPKIDVLSFGWTRSDLPSAPSRKQPGERCPGRSSSASSGNTGPGPPSAAK